MSILARMVEWVVENGVMLNMALSALAFYITEEPVYYLLHGQGIKDNKKMEILNQL